MITLSDVLEAGPMAAAGPVLRTQVAGSHERPVRWVHSSEVLEIAPLLRGGELLLSGGQALLGLGLEEQRAYVRSLGQRGIAALAIETAGSQYALSEEFVAFSEEQGVPLIELRRTAPFVDIAEEINRLIVNRQAGAHLVVDDISRQIAQHITGSGPHIPTILQLIADTLGAEAVLSTSRGELIGRAGTYEGTTPSEAKADIVIGGQYGARLTLISDSADEDRMDVAAERLSGILALALAQHFRPSIGQIADTSLLLGIIEGNRASKIHTLWAQAGLAPDHGAIVGVFRGHGREPSFAPLERALRPVAPALKSHVWNGELVVLAPIGPRNAMAQRAALMSVATTAATGSPIRGAFGPTVPNPAGAHASYVEASEVLNLAPGPQRPVLDAMDYFGLRILSQVENRTFIDPYIQAAVGSVMRWDEQHHASLVETLLRWLELGCNTTAAAARLHVERQTLHKRLNKIFELLGQDPRETGQLFTIHLAIRLLAARETFPG